MKPTDLDDRAPLEPDDELLARVHVRSGSFRRRRNTQRLTSGMSALVVLALAGGIAWTRLDTTNGRGIRPAPSATTTTTLPTVAATALIGEWRPVSITGYEGPLTKPPLGRAPRLSFDGRGRWSGSDGCNDMGGTYRLGSGGAFAFAVHQSTAVGCIRSTPTPASLEAADRVEIRNGRLRFLGRDGRPLAHYVRSGVTARVVLPALKMIAGSSMSGHVVVENNTGHALHATGCISLFQVALGNAQTHPAPAWPLCLQEFTIPTGKSTYPVTVRASYPGCSATVQSGLPVCLPSGRPPPLPPGNYRAMLFESGNVVPTPPAIDVRVEPQRSAR